MFVCVPLGGGGRGFSDLSCDPIFVCILGTRASPADRDKGFRGKRLSRSPHQSLSWLLVLCVPATSVKHSDKAQSEELHDYSYLPSLDVPKNMCVFCPFHNFSPRASPFQAPAGCLWQMLLHHDSLWGVQEEKKVRGDKKTCFNDMFTATRISKCNFLFIAQDSTLYPTPLASLTATFGPCTRSTGCWWRTATWHLVRWKNFSFLDLRRSLRVSFKRLPPSVQITSTDWKRKRRSTTRCTRTFRTTSSIVYR